MRAHRALCKAVGRGCEGVPESSAMGRQGGRVREACCGGPSRPSTVLVGTGGCPRHAWCHWMMQAVVGLDRCVCAVGERSQRGIAIALEGCLRSCMVSSLARSGAWVGGVLELSRGCPLTLLGHNLCAWYLLPLLELQAWHRLQLLGREARVLHGSGRAQGWGRTALRMGACGRHPWHQRLHGLSCGQVGVRAWAQARGAISSPRPRSQAMLICSGWMPAWAL